MAVEVDGGLEVGYIGEGVAEACGCCEVVVCFVMYGLADVVYFFFLFCAHLVEGVVYFGAEGVAFYGGGIGGEGAGAFECCFLHVEAAEVGVDGYAFGAFCCCLVELVYDAEFGFDCGFDTGKGGDGCGCGGIVGTPEDGGADHVEAVGVAVLHLFLFFLPQRR